MILIANQIGAVVLRHNIIFLNGVRYALRPEYDLDTQGATRLYSQILQAASSEISLVTVIGLVGADSSLSSLWLQEKVDYY